MRLPDWVKRLIARKIWKEATKKMPILQKLIGNNIAGIIGILQLVVPLLRELIIVGIRLVDVLLPGAGLEPLIVKVSEVLGKVEAGIVWIKNTFLGRAA